MGVSVLHVMPTVHTYGTSFYVSYSLQYLREKTFHGNTLREGQRFFLVVARNID